MRAFEEILAITAERKGGIETVLGSVPAPLQSAELAATPDDRWLSMMTRCVFRAGFNWKVVENKWDGFEAAFFAFAVGRCAFMSDAWLDELISDQRIVRHGPKIQAVQMNAVFISEYSEASGGFGSFVANWPEEDLVGLLQIFKSQGSRLGGTTGAYVLRNMGKETFILTRDVVSRLTLEGVIDGKPTSKHALGRIQDAFNEWRDQSGQSFNVISRVLAQSV